MVPHGNSNATWNSQTQNWEFTCQHGPNECWGNMFETCVFYLYPDLNVSIPFVECIEAIIQDRDFQTAALKCSDLFRMQYDRITDCQQKIGPALQYANAVKTKSLNPPHTFIPWITINDMHTDQIQQAALNDLLGLVCKFYQGPTQSPACRNIY